MPRVMHFEIPAADPRRAAEFYRNDFAWDIRKWDGPMDCYLVATGPKEVPGIDGAIMGQGTAMSTVNTIEVPSSDEFLAKVIKSGAHRRRRRTRSRTAGSSAIAPTPRETCSASCSPSPAACSRAERPVEGPLWGGRRNCRQDHFCRIVFCACLQGGSAH